MIQWLRYYASNSGDTGSILGQRTKIPNASRRGQKINHKIKHKDGRPHWWVYAARKSGRLSISPRNFILSWFNWSQELPPHIIPTRTPPCQPSLSPQDPRGPLIPLGSAASSGPAPLLARWPGRQVPPSPGAAHPRPPTSAWQACLISLTSRAPVPGGCHGHGDSTAALGDAPRGSVAGTRVQPEDKQGPSRHPSPHGVPTMCTSGPGLRDF